MNYYSNAYPYGMGMYQASPVQIPQNMPVQTPQSAPAAAQTPQDDRIWVASEAAAEAFPVTAGGFVRLWDSNVPVYYEKRADMSGRPLPIVAYEYKVKEAEVTMPAPAVDYEPKIREIEERIKKLEGSIKKPTAKKGEDEA